jgi:hypothetical protein
MEAESCMMIVVALDGLSAAPQRVAPIDATENRKEGH